MWLVHGGALLVSRRFLLLSANRRLLLELVFLIEFHIAIFHSEISRQGW